MTFFQRAFKSPPHSFFRLLGLLALGVPSVFSASLTWQGDLGTAAWGAGVAGTDTNWTNNALPVNGDSLIFSLPQAGVANLSVINDLNGLVLGGTNAISFVNDGGTDTGFSLSGNAVTLGGNITSSGTTGVHAHLISFDLLLNGTRTVTTVQNTTISIEGQINESGGAYGLVKAGAGTLVLSGLSSFSGASSINQGVLSVNSIADTGTASALGAGGQVNIGSGTATGGALTYTGAEASTNRAVNLAATTTGGATINSSGSGALVFTGVFTNAGSGAKTLTLGGISLSNNEIQSLISNGAAGGTLSITKTNAATWLLTNPSNSFTGLVSISQGILSATSIANSGLESALGAGSQINLGSGNQTGTLVYTGPAASTNRTFNLASTGGGGGAITSDGSGPLTLTGNVVNAAVSGTKTLTLGGSALNNEIQGLISNGDGSAVLAVTKNNSTGSWILSNDANSFSGVLTVQRGTLRVTSLGAKGVVSAAGAGTALHFGTGAQSGLLNYTGAGVVTDRDISLVVGANTGSGTISNNGSGALVFTGLFSNQGSAGTKVFTLGGANADANEFQSLISDGGLGGIVAFTKADAGSWTLANPANTFTGNVTVNNGVLRVASIADAGTASALGAGAALNFGSGANTGTLAYTGEETSVNRSINLVSTGAGGGAIHNNGTNGGLILNGVFTNLGTTGSKTLTLGGTNTDANQFQSLISNGSAGGILALAKSGEGSWALTSQNTYSGGTTLSAGTLNLNHGGSEGTSSAIGTGTLTITGGALGNSSGAAVVLSTNNTVAINGDFSFVGGNDLSLGGGIATIGNANRAITLDSSATLTLGELRWNSVNGARILTVDQGAGSGGRLVLAGFQLNVNADTVARNRALSGSAQVEISGVISNGNSFANGLVYSGTGTLTLSAANTYSGITTVNLGTLKLGHAGALTTSSGLTVNSGAVDVHGFAASIAGGLTLGAATTSVGGLTAALIDSASGGAFTLNGNVAYNTGSAGFHNGQATVSANLDLGGADRVFTVNDSSAATVDLLVSGFISGSSGITKAGNGTLRLTAANTFTGQALLNNGIIQAGRLGNIGDEGALGTGNLNAAAGIIRLGFQASAGALEYIGGGESTNRRIQIGGGANVAHTGGASLLSNGTGPLVFTAANFNSPVNTGTGTAGPGRVLTLGGGNTGANTIQGVIANNLQTLNPLVALVKQDGGTWILQGSNTYGGGTQVTGGTLLVNNAAGSATGTGSVTVGIGARLGGSGTAGSLTSGATFTLADGATLFAGQHGVLDAQTLDLQAAGGFTLAGTIELDILGGGSSGVLNGQAGNADQLVFSGGSIDLTGSWLKISSSLPVNSGTWVEGSAWRLFDWAGLTGNFDNLPTSGLQQGNPADLPDLSPLGLSWDWSQLYSSGTLSIVLVPEPSRALLVLSGAMVLVLRRRRAFPAT